MESVENGPLWEVHGVQEKKVSTVAKVAFALSFIIPLGILITTIEAVILLAQYVSSKMAQQNKPAEESAVFRSYKEPFTYEFTIGNYEQFSSDNATEKPMIVARLSENKKTVEIGETQKEFVTAFGKALQNGSFGTKLKNSNEEAVTSAEAITKTFEDWVGNDTEKTGLSSPFEVAQVLLTEHMHAPFVTSLEQKLGMDQGIIAKDREGTHSIQLMQVIEVNEKKVYPIVSKRCVDFVPLTSDGKNTVHKSYEVTEKMEIQDGGPGKPCKVKIMREVEEISKPEVSEEY